MKRFIAAAALTVSMALAVPAFADPLDDAKAQGIVGERPDGYLGAVKPEGKALADSINAGRKAEYQRVATQNGQPVQVVEKLMGEKLTARTPSGQYVMDGSGNWVKK